MERILDGGNALGCLDFDGVSARVADDDREKWDALVPQDVLHLSEGRLCFPSRYVLPGQKSELQPTGWAQTQICQKLGIPPGYFAKCPAHLRDAQANYWLRTRSQMSPVPARVRPGGTAGWLLRANGNRVRGVLSERYTRIDNARIVQALAPILTERQQKVQWFTLTDESMHLRVVDMRLRRDVLPGDGVAAGLHIAQSEVGRRRITVDALVYRLVCQNGLVRLVKGRSIFERRHVGGFLEEKPLAEALEGAVRAALMSASGFVERMASSTQIRLDDPHGVIATIATDWSLPDSQRDAITAALIAEGRLQTGQDETLFGLVNALTFVAQGLAPDDRFDLETRAGRLLEYGPPTVRAVPSERSFQAERAERRHRRLVGASAAPASPMPVLQVASGGARVNPALDLTLSMDPLFEDAAAVTTATRQEGVIR